MFERRGRDHEIGAVIAEIGAQGAPTPRGSQVEWHYPLAVEGQDAVQPVCNTQRKLLHCKIAAPDIFIRGKASRILAMHHFSLIDDECFLSNP